MITEEINNLIEKAKRSFEAAKRLSDDYLSSAFEDRQTGDYEAVIVISKEQAETHIKNAEEFLAQTTEYMGGLK